MKNHNRENNSDKSAIIKEFDGLASSFDTNRLSSWYQAHGKMVLDLLSQPKNGDILDIGSGTGWLLRQVAKIQLNQECIGIDISSRMVDIAKAKASKDNLPNLDFIHGDWEQIDLSFLNKKNITIITCTNTFHYFAEPLKAAKKMYQTLNPEGCVYLIEREKNNSILTHVWDILHRFWIKDHVKFYPSSKLVKYFKSAGFSDVMVNRRIKKYFWKGKLYTSLVLISGKKLE